MKTPNGVHLRPDIKAQITALYEGGTKLATNISQQISGLTAKQAQSFTQKIRDPSALMRSRLSRAREITGSSDATAADYHRQMKAALAQRMTGDPKATSADYDRAKKAERGRNRAGNEASSGRPFVPLSSREEAISRSWNAGDRFFIPGPDGNPRYVEVTRNRQGGEEVHQGDFKLLFRGG